MVSFIVVDDNVRIVDMIKQYINEQMMKNNVEYKIHTFFDYDKNFFDKIDQISSHKVYILDIETQSGSGIDAARRIRKNDIDSVIIFATSHDELGSVVIKEQLMVLTFICKFDDFESKLKLAVAKSLEVLNHKSAIRFDDCSTTYTIPIKDILYITRDSVERRCFIKTDYTTYRVNKTLIEIKDLAKNGLVYSHRSCLVNPDRIRTIKKNENIIVFDNGETTDFLSGSYKKELSKC